VPIPTFEEVMLPLLQTIKDKREYSLRQVEESVAEHFQLTEEERNRLLPSGKMTYLYNRIGWAKTDLKFAGLIEQSGRGLFKITERGLQVLNENPQKIDVEYLTRFPEFVEWQNKEKEDKREPISTNTMRQSPQETIDAGFQTLQEALYNDVLDKVKSVSNSGFERLILDLLKKMNYGDITEHTGKTGDQGIDGIIKEDRLGLGEIYLQAKKWDGNVSSKDVRNFAGSLQATKSKKGIFITSSDFTPDCIEFIKNLRSDSTIILINGKELAKLMVEYDVGVSEENVYKIKRLDNDYFDQYL
jgi:restriction system protein